MINCNLHCLYTGTRGKKREGSAMFRHYDESNTASLKTLTMEIG